MSAYIPHIVVFPLLAFVVNIFGGRFIGRRAAWISIGTSLISCLIALPTAWKVVQGERFMHSWPWLNMGSYELHFGYFIDPAAATLLFVVAVIGTLIQIYSVGYMHNDPRYSRFFAYLSLFMAAMLTVVIADNYLLFFMGWEVMGLCSYLLIGFWFEKTSAANACKKAFLTTRVGDVGFFLGILTCFTVLGTLNLQDLESATQVHHGAPMIALAAFLIFCGTIGKSAQFPLHVWLPDAMEGPTPVSALIHAATMVAAGVYLIIRSFPLFEAAPAILALVAVVGTVTAFMAAVMALTATDIKKVLAYSTISQLGYMVAALGMGGYSAGLFHLMTHAFFKALLFLGAGSVIHGTGTQDIRELGGLFGKMKSTGWTFLIASLAIAGIPPFAGFWSKDEILLTASHAGTPFLFWILVFTALLTSFYMFRLVFLTFFGRPRNKNIHAHESPPVMTLPLWGLALGSIFMGLPGSPWAHYWFQNFLLGPHHATEQTIDWGGIGLSITVAVLGIVLAAWIYLKNLSLAETLARTFRPLYQISFNQFWFDEIYAAFLIRPFHGLGRILFAFDQWVIDGAVKATALITRGISYVQDWIDRYVVDGTVNFVGAVTRLFSAILRKIQTGFIQNYLLFAFLGAVILIYFNLR